MKTWYDIYVERMNDDYRLHMVTKYGPMVDKLLSLLPRNVGRKLAEYGCGAANISRLLVEKACKNGHVLPFIHLVDIDTRMLDLATTNIKETGMQLKEDFAVTQANILEPVTPFFASGYDIIYSHGVLEHFSDNQIRYVIRQQLNKAPVLVHYVPSHKYTEPSFGDERLLTATQWADICHPDDIIEFNDGYDLLLVWDKRDKEDVYGRFING